MYKTREEWLKEAVKLINKYIFNEGLDLIDFQIGMSLMGGTKLGDTVFPYQGEDVDLNDFFPPTIHIDEKIKDPVEIVEVLVHECIHCFLNIKGHSKKFAEEAHAVGFEDPVKELHAGPILEEVCKSIVKELGEFPGKPIVVKHKEAKDKKKFSGKIFCPDCGYEFKVSEKMWNEHNQGLPICPCGSKMALEYDYEEGAETEE